MEGWIKLHRQILDNEFYFSERFTKIQAWIDLLLLATHKERTVFIRGVEIKLLPGQLCYSQVSLSKRWKWNRRTVVKWLKELSNKKMIHSKKDNITTIITIKKWDLYQGDAQQSAQQNAQQNAQQSAHKQECNRNVKKELIFNLARSLIKTINKESCFYSITYKYIKVLGEARMLKILSDFNAKDGSFENENRLAAYLEACKNSNGHNNKLKLKFNPIGC